MPLTVAPPPWNGDAARGRRPADAPAFAASDRAAAPDEAPRVEPARPAPAAIARTLAAGVLLSAGALVLAAGVVLVPALLRFAFADSERLSFGGFASVLVTLGLALAYAAALALGAWPWPARRPATLLLAAVVTMAWPLSGYPFPAAFASIVAVALALARDRRTPGGRRVAGPWPTISLVAAAFVAATAGLAMAEGHPLRPAIPALYRTDTPGVDDSATGSAFSADTAAPFTPEAEKGAVKVPGDGAAAPAAETPESPAAHTPAKDTPASPAAETPQSPAAPTPAPPATDPPAADTPESPAAPATDAPSAHSTVPPVEGAPDSPTTGTPDSPAAHTPASPVPEAPAGDTPASPLADEATAFVRDYYKSLDERRFDDAWASLSPSVRGAFGGLAHWKSGYARTVSSRPRDLAVRTDGNATVVEHRLLAREKGCASTLNFSVIWRLERVSDTWKVAGLRGTALPGPRC